MNPTDTTAPLGADEIDELLGAEVVTGQETDFDRATRDYRPVPIGRLRPGMEMTVDVFLPRLDRANKTVTMSRILESGGGVISTKVLERLAMGGFGTVYFHVDDVPMFLRCLNENCRRLIEDPRVEPEVKAGLLYDNATQIIEQAMADPRLGENVKVGVEYVSDVTGFITSTPEGVKSLADVLSTDYTLYTHSVNVCLMTVGLAHFMGFGERDIIVFGSGSLFHDMGKRDIPQSVLTKPGRLDDDEWRLMKKHPSVGFDLLRTGAKLPAKALDMVIEHHENLDGSGYPRGLKGDQISRPGRIIRIIDAYDAITSKRWYKDAIKPFEAITIMRKEMAGQMSEKLLQAFIAFLGRIAP